MIPIDPNEINVYFFYVQCISVLIFVVLAYFKCSWNVDFMLRKNTKFWASLCILPEPKFGEELVEVEPLAGAAGDQYAPGGFGFFHENDVNMDVGCETVENKFAHYRENGGDDDEKDGYNSKERWQKRRYKIKLAKKEDLGALLDALIHSFGRFIIHD